MTISVLSRICLSFSSSNFDLKVVVALIPLPLLQSTTDKEYIVKLAVWLVVVIGIAVAMEFFLPAFSCFLGFACLFFSLGERWKGALA